MVGSTASLASMATFYQARWREAVLSHFPAHVGSHFRALLSASSLAGPNLFEDSVLDKVLAESRWILWFQLTLRLSRQYLFLCLEL